MGSQILLKNLIMTVMPVVYACAAQGQEYNRQAICGSDTVHVRHVSMRTGELISYEAFRCRQVSRWGIRVEIGRSSFIYSPETDHWLGRHNGGSFGFHIAYGDFNLGAKCVLTSTNPKTELMVDGKVLPIEARVNPVKIEYSAGYSLNLKYNFCLEPYVAITSNKFLVVNEDTLGKHYQIPQVAGFTTGAGLNKYFRIKEYQFLTVFVRYAHSFTNFKKVNSDLGMGYSEWCFGVAYKGFTEKLFLRPLHNTRGLKRIYPRP